MPHTILTAQNLIALQRAVGNRAVQRYVPVDLGGKLDDTTYDKRAGEAERGGTGFGEANKGWIKVASPDRGEGILTAESTYGQGHAEEKLLKMAADEYPGLNLKTDPTAQNALRVVELYSERAPCTAETAGYPRKSRGEGNCHVMLTKRLHSTTPVRFSVAHQGVAFEALRELGRRTYAMEVAQGRRQGNAGLSSYIQQGHRDLYGNDKPGRNYWREQNEWEAMTRGATLTYRNWFSRPLKQVTALEFRQSGFASYVWSQKETIMRSVPPGPDSTSGPILKKIEELESTVTNWMVSVAKEDAWNGMMESVKATFVEHFGPREGFTEDNFNDTHYALDIQSRKQEILNSGPSGPNSTIQPILGQIAELQSEVRSDIISAATSGNLHEADLVHDDDMTEVDDTLV